MTLPCSVIGAVTLDVTNSQPVGGITTLFPTLVDPAPHQALSYTGRYVMFSSYSDAHVTGDTNGGLDVFVHDRTLQTTHRVTVDSSRSI